ncbi:MAG: hypothetical protein WAN86_16325 [Hyphomicrobiaceae bacterium]
MAPSAGPDCSTSDSDRSLHELRTRRDGSDIDLPTQLSGLPKCGRSEQQKRIEAESDLAAQAQDWITVVWRKDAPGSADDDRQSPTDIHRLCTTRFGRRKYRSSWPVD